MSRPVTRWISAPVGKKYIHAHVSPDGRGITVVLVDDKDDENAVGRS